MSPVSPKELYPFRKMRRFFAFYRITRLAILRLDAYAFSPHPPSPFPDGLIGESAFQFSS
jgi:hypothetical protein